MYSAGYFLENDTDKLVAFMQANPFAVLIGANEGMPAATQIPVQVRKDGNSIKLIGHVMKNTDHYHAFVANEQVLVLFSGAHAYISAAVYENPESASTWNYTSVQAKGKLRLLDTEQTRAAIKSLTDEYEAHDSPAAFHRLSDEYVNHHLKAIAGFEITVTSLKGVFKLSQNHSQTNRAHIVDYLSQSTDPQAKDIAERMRKEL